MKFKLIRDNDTDTKSAEVADSNAQGGANEAPSADVQAKDASRNVTEYAVYFNMIEGARSGCGYTGRVFVEAKTEEAAEAIVREDFSTSFTDVMIDEVEEDEDSEEEEERMWNVYVNAKGKNLEYDRLWVMLAAESEEDARKQALGDFEAPFDLRWAEISVEMHT